MRKEYLLLFFFVFAYSNAQDISQHSVDTKYREDQFYASISYNLLSDDPDEFSQSGISTGFNIGFIRDMPINKRRNWAIGIGLGFSSNSYNQNLRISEFNGDYTYSIIDESTISVSKNKFTRYFIEAPIEIRWRTSTATDYKFWRIYSGLKIGYLLYDTSKFRSSIGDENVSNIDDFHELQYGLTLSAGYNTWNFQLYYGLNPLFKKEAQIDGEPIDLRAIKIGIIFYIL